MNTGGCYLKNRFKIWKKTSHNDSKPENTDSNIKSKASKRKKTGYLFSL